MRTIAFAAAICFGMPALAAGSFEILDAKMTSGIDGKEPSDTKATFTTGQKAYVWMKVKPSGENPMLRIKYSADGNHIWTMDPVPAHLGRLWYYKTLHTPGSWKAEILDDANQVVHTLSFTVTGDPVLSEAPVPAPTGPGVEASTHAAVIELKLANEIKDRSPVSPTTTFTKGSKVFAWVKLHVKDPETQVKLRWSVSDKPVYTSNPVTVKQSPGWRTWLYKTTDTPGKWTVEVIDADEKVFYKTDFNVN